jgi:hypothetical protein
VVRDDEVAQFLYGDLVVEPHLSECQQMVRRHATFKTSDRRSIAEDVFAAPAFVVVESWRFEQPFSGLELLVALVRIPLQD